jgi:hypothetical protein
MVPEAMRGGKRFPGRDQDRGAKPAGLAVEAADGLPAAVLGLDHHPIVGTSELRTGAGIGMRIAAETDHRN